MWWHPSFGMFYFLILEESTWPLCQVQVHWNKNVLNCHIKTAVERVVCPIYMWWLIPRRRGLLGRLMVTSCMLFGGCRDRFLMRTPYRTLDRWRFGMRMVGMLLAPSASCIFPSRLYASLPRTHNWLISLMSTRCLSLRPPAAMADGWFLPLQTVSWTDLCNAFFEHHDHAFLLGACWRRLLWACKCLPSLWRGQPSAAAPEARWTLRWAGWLSWCNFSLPKQNLNKRNFAKLLQLDERWTDTNRQLPVSLFLVIKAAAYGYLY